MGFPTSICICRNDERHTKLLGSILTFTFLQSDLESRLQIRGASGYRRRSSQRFRGKSVVDGWGWRESRDHDGRGSRDFGTSFALVSSCHRRCQGPPTLGETPWPNRDRRPVTPRPGTSPLYKGSSTRNYPSLFQLLFSYRSICGGTGTSGLAQVQGSLWSHYFGRIYYWFRPMYLSSRSSREVGIL